MQSTCRKKINGSVSFLGEGGRDLRGIQKGAINGSAQI